ncbi:pilus assembly protein PilY [Aquisalimonas sp. 2447]|uniref:pilus assembly protein n=1 Tax=Aquisalimonas sp. 2447 TaxID=2740807 RepID=UPI001432465F|nr:PilC/PilY family type IV pilus protein [Aquisalimonas sp. 2447]QIT56618.1 pilus assembly protein PilY [Aquisalimonas sp. 2447]
MKRSHGYRQTSVLLASGFLTAGALMSSAHAGLNLTTNPLFLASGIEPNVMFTIDDSGSMRYEITPDELRPSAGYRYLYPESDDVYGSGGYNVNNPYNEEGEPSDPRFLSADFNSTYYDPTVNYRPWIRADGTRFPDADETAAVYNPAAPSRGEPMDLTTDNNWGDATYFPATYYVYEGGANGDPENHDDYQLIEIVEGSTYKGGPNRSDCGPNPEQCSYEQEIQNFANWFSYYRSRGLAARGAIGRAFAPQDSGIRVGFGSINQSGNDVDGVNTSTVSQGVRVFSGDNRQEFYDALYDPDIPASGTPLRRAAVDVGEYFSRDDQRGPWSTTPGELGGSDLECRRSSHVLMTDGYWSGPSPNVGNVDGTSGEVIPRPDDDGDTYQYVPGAPFEDDYSNTLADAAMAYWKRDLREDLRNRVPTTENNPAYWQHLTTYGVGLGVNGTVDPDDAFAAIQSGDTIDWPDPQNSNEAKLDDLLHAAVNTRGGFFSAQDPETFAEELSDLLTGIAAEANRSTGGVSANSTALQDGTLLFQARFESGSWTGDLEAYDATSNDMAPVWVASEQVPHYSNRRIIAGDGIDLEQDAFGGNRERWDWFRGNLDLDEMAEFRDRGGNPIGDIINSEPVLAGTFDFQYERLPSNEGGDSYRDFFDDHKTHDVVFIGANDGMLHAFDAEDGRELFAFVPESVLHKLDDLPNPEYADNHQFFVDGSVTVNDAYIGGRWRTVLVGSTGLGGRSVFAIDVTDPENPEALWEFTDPDLGYTVGKPTIARLANGDWVAAFGNGYNSEEHDAVFFTIDLENGEIQDRIRLSNGAANDPNGLASVVPADLTGDRITDRFYAGDLNGNMHRIDASDADNLEANVLFQATDRESGQPQPITSRPAVSGHPDPGVVMVFFGTGQFLENGDNVIADDEQIQTFYGVRDDGDVTDVDRGDLLPQEIEEQSEQDGFRIRRSSRNSFSEDDPEGGWFIDLLFDGVRGTPQRGERVLFAPQLAAGRVSFTTFTPNDEDPCAGGGFNWLMELNAIDGSQSDRPIFDLSGDGEMDFDGSGVAFGEGPPTPEGQTLEVDDETGELVYDVDEDRLGRDRSYDAGVLGRQSWREFD